MTVWNLAPQLSIKYKLLAGFLLVLILVAAFGVYAVGTLNTVDKSFNEVERQQEDLVKLAQLQNSHTALADSVKALIITRNQKWERLYDAASIDFDKTVAELKAREGDPEGMEVLTQFEAINNRVKGTELLILAKAKEGEVARATRLFDANYEGFQRDASRQLANLVNKETQGIGEDIQEGKSLLVSIKKVLVILLAGIVIAVVIISLFLAALITRPLKKLLGAAQTIAQGDLTARVENSSRDEIGRLAAAFNEMADKLQESYSSLEESRDYVDSVVRSMVDTLVVIDTDGTIMTVNQATLDLLGCAQDEVIGKPIEVIIAQEGESTGEKLQEVQTKGFIRDLDLTYQTKLGERVAVSFSGSVMRDPTGKVTAIVGVARDMREMNQLQVQLVQAGKMAGLGQIGAGIAHELNQPITSIQGFAQRLRRNCPAQASEELDIIINATHRMARIVNNIRGFARQDEFKPEPTEPARPLDDALMLISEQLRLHGVEVEKTVEKTLPRVRADSVRLQQVFLNLLGNALDALDQVEEGSPKRLLLAVGRDGDQVVYTIEDTGPGVPKDNDSQIFNPFFTTKPPGKGTGLGLSLSYRIVADHGGEITYERASSGGALFTVRIHVVPKDAGNRPE